MVLSDYSCLVIIITIIVIHFHTVICFEVFLSNNNNFQTDLFEPKWTWD